MLLSYSSVVGIHQVNKMIWFCSLLFFQLGKFFLVTLSAETTVLFRLLEYFKIPRFLNSLVHHEAILKNRKVRTSTFLGN